ncbi:MAG: tetratricopeptide repeat protein [Bryobacterales bacterium]|nr:tetratricopeptide repeat protein [Bryobacterales bacterium]
MTALAAVPRVEVQRGFDHFYNLEFDDAIGTFRGLVARFPEDASLHNHLAESILYREMLRAGALETELVTGGNAFLRRAKMNPSPAAQAEFDKSIANAMAAAQKVLDKAPNDKQALYALGIAHGLRANYNFVVRKAWMDALRDATTARKLHNKLSEIYPSYVDARLTQGVHDYIVGSLPWTYKVLGFIAGFRGDREEGIRTIERVYANGEDNRTEAAVLLATIYRRERRPSVAVPLLEGLIAKYPRNYLFRLELAQMYSDLGNKQKALAAVAEVEEIKRSGYRGYDHLPDEKILYFRATIQFWYNDLDEALKNFLKVTAKANDLDPNTGVTAWMRLGQTYDLKGDRSRAVEAYKKAIAYAPGSYRAKEAEEYLRSAYRHPRQQIGLFGTIPSVGEDLTEPIFGGLVIAGSDRFEAWESVGENTVILEVQGRATQLQEICERHIAGSGSGALQCEVAGPCRPGVSGVKGGCAGRRALEGTAEADVNGQVDLFPSR